MAELEMLPEWAGRKAAMTPSLPADADDTAPIPAVGPVEAIVEPIPEVDDAPVVDVEPEPEAARDEFQPDAAVGEFTQPANVVDQPVEGRSSSALLVFAFVALLAGIGAGYLYLLLAG